MHTFLNSSLICMNTVKTHIRTGKYNFPLHYFQDFPQHWNGMGEGHQSSMVKPRSSWASFGIPGLTSALEIPYIYTASFFSTVHKCANYLLIYIEHHRVWVQNSAQDFHLWKDVFTNLCRPLLWSRTMCVLYYGCEWCVLTHWVFVLCVCVCEKICALWELAIVISQKYVEIYSTY